MQSALHAPLVNPELSQRTGGQVRGGCIRRPGTGPDPARNGGLLGICPGRPELGQGQREPTRAAKILLAVGDETSRGVLEAFDLR